MESGLLSSGLGREPFKGGREIFLDYLGRYLWGRGVSHAALRSLACSGIQAYAIFKTGMNLSLTPQGVISSDRWR